MISRTVIVAGVVLMAGANGAALAREPPFVGAWARSDGKTRIRVEPCGANFCGTNTWVKPGASAEKVGDRLIVTLKRAGAERWSGQAFDPQRHVHYAMTIRVADRRMTTAGCVFGGLVCQSMNWTRVDRTK